MPCISDVHYRVLLQVRGFESLMSRGGDSASTGGFLLVEVFGLNIRDFFY